MKREIPRAATAIGAVVVLAFYACGGAGSGSSDAPDGGADAAAADATTTTSPGTVDAGRPLADASPDDDASDLDAGGPADAGPPYEVRAYLTLAPHDSAGLDATIAALYDPTSATFRQYLSHADLLSLHAPTQADVDTVTAWLASQSLAVAHVPTNRLVLEVHGSRAAFGTAFQTSLAPATAGGFIFVTPPQMPAALASVVVSLVAPDTPPAPGGPPTDTGTATTTGPATPSSSFLVSQIATAYNASALYTAGSKGAGVAIGIVGTGGGRPSDLHTFWGAQQIARADIHVVTVTDPPAVWNTEATLDLEWSGGIAPAANLYFYNASDNHEGSLLYAMNEAVGSGTVDIVSDSFSHHESVVPVDVRAAYDVIGRFAAASGITLLAASGDTNVVDFPAASPWWTAVGGTELTLAADGSISKEIAWNDTGCGLSALEPAPSWQAAAVFGANGTRAVVDLSAHAKSYFVANNGAWQIYGGTSFASPVTAGLMALATSARISAGKPKIGYLNSILYGTPGLQAVMHDITSGASGTNAARAGWDYPTGWGTTDIAAFASALP